MAILEINEYPDPILKKKCSNVKEITPEIQKLIKDMIQTMREAPGVGLAACQVGVSLKICVIEGDPYNKNNAIALINPKIVAREGIATEEEGCLSFPGVSEPVKRALKTRVEAINEKGMPIRVEGEGLVARALQHEIDHLNGVVFVDYLPWLKKIRIKRELRKRKKQGIK